MKFTKKEYKKNGHKFKFKIKLMEKIRKIKNKFRRKNLVKWNGLFKN